MRDLAAFILAAAASFAFFYRLFSKKKQDTKQIDIEQPEELKPFAPSGKMVEVLKRFNEMKQKI
ncbi:hypothetical protein [Persephonella sp. IF05-L8]|uniref:hypothetical protein n=1 Tax=Persephonella sp. IF05-L8 TaxID=1158338 RepID=UPI000496686E